MPLQLLVVVQIELLKHLIETKTLPGLASVRTRWSWNVHDRTSCLHPSWRHSLWAESVPPRLTSLKWSRKDDSIIFLVLACRPAHFTSMGLDKSSSTLKFRDMILVAECFLSSLWSVPVVFERWCSLVLIWIKWYSCDLSNENTTYSSRSNRASERPQLRYVSSDLSPTYVSLNLSHHLRRVPTYPCPNSETPKRPHDVRPRPHCHVLSPKGTCDR